MTVSNCINIQILCILLRQVCQSAGLPVCHSVRLLVGRSACLPVCQFFGQRPRRERFAMVSPHMGKRSVFFFFFSVRPSQLGGPSSWLHLSATQLPLGPSMFPLMSSQLLPRPSQLPQKPSMLPQRPPFSLVTVLVLSPLPITTKLT